MNAIVFFDSEIDPNTFKILDIGGIAGDGKIFHYSNTNQFIEFLKGNKYLCGHNIFSHDLKHLGKTIAQAGIQASNCIDTLYLSPLLFPTKPYHALLKDDKLQTDETNNPVNDAIKAKDLFFDEVESFRNIAPSLQQIFFLLLRDQREFQGFFKFINFTCEDENVSSIIRQRFKDTICQSIDLGEIISKHPISLAFSLSLINTFSQSKKHFSITPPWVLKNFPEVERIMFLLRSSPCIESCSYCNQALDIHRGLKRFFGYSSFRSYGGEPLQEKAVRAAVANKSILAVFPTGGGKSITFQVPALICGESSRGLTVVISPLQSLMKDQVDNLEKAGITEAVTINGLLDPIERSKSFERVQDGSASIIYISPESLRSKTIERLILGRKISRFVIDEAHCFSSWGQDFRVDYLYIGDFIKNIQEKKNLSSPIPVSCFTATAKQKVIEDIREYFKRKLNLNLQLFTSKVSRTNLQYQVFEKGNEEEKYQALRDLIELKNCPTIIYVSRTRKAYKLAERLLADGYESKPYHGKMDKQEKSENQDSFINGKTQIMVATSAFGMGVDKKNVGMVIHYEISDSLENYIQEAGRAGRDENILADCFVLFNEEDLSKHFVLLNQTKLSIKEIQQVWKAIKEITKFRHTVSNSALEIARKAGWDENVVEIETRVTTAIAALEDAGYLKRGQNMPRVFANSILAKTAQEAIDKINSSERFQERQKEQGVRIIKKLFSSKSRKHSNEEVAESRVDYISDHLGLVKEEVINIVNLLREEKILADAKDLTAFIKQGENINRSLQLAETYGKIENHLLPIFEQEEKNFQIKELNEQIEALGIEEVSPQKIKIILNFWAIKNWINRKADPFSKNHISVITLHPREILKEKLQKRHVLAKFIVEYLFQKNPVSSVDLTLWKEEVLVEFSVLELLNAYEKSQDLFKLPVNLDDIEDTLFYLSKIEALKIEGGFLVVYNRLTIERLERDNKKRFTKDDYQKLHQFYENKVQQIHIVGEYAKKMIRNYRDALQFVEDYFQLNYASFLRKYFPGSKSDELRLRMTPAKFRQLFGELSPTQLKIINDNETKYIAVAAGPGSGKTRILVHKLASLLLMEDVKHEQLLMVTFSRAAATEFKHRLLGLIGNAASFVEIKTFHSYCFDLLGKVGSLEKSGDILKKTVEKIRKGEVEANRITKTVLVIDEAQDMDEDEFELIKALMHHNEEMRVIAVGDDDQNIYEFRGSNSAYFEKFINAPNSAKYELVENYRSLPNLIEFTNDWVQKISHRLKKYPIMAKQSGHGSIKIIRYQSPTLLIPVVQQILSVELKGSTCILTKTNEEALQLTGLLLKNGVKAKLIQANEDFSLYNLAEVRYFLGILFSNADTYLIQEELWEFAKRELIKRYHKSEKLEICQSLIRAFELSQPRKKYKSDWEVFLRESRLEDYLQSDQETILVSTIHKVKGKEFDNVFLMLQNFKVGNDSEKRLLYVAMTRAKQNLTIHLNSGFLDGFSSKNLEWIEDKERYSTPDILTVQLTFKDIWLDYFINKQYYVSQLVCGEKLVLKGTECLTPRGQSILKFSKQFVQILEQQKEKGFEPRSAKVNFILFWKKEETGQEIQIVLPEIQFEKVTPTI
ncbi:RecQ family ATP-dependent DNA helicase [Algoriphagus sp. D3-2-R+10]|uniref:RecQ family ATP-dependent DNA helicase n=1 Tax=Algoriphagus aurantiacus TaxID=3103948 RepID=UPI002B3BD51D|nr:RecQ family ATP-dependent DNA helicase [Algoriphagus sp. D3-2-R+10]MEB2776804.1 RecQ family ATP-dependent DNA helicase [Algoriphagus sp. D3-2-R+10]